MRLAPVFSALAFLAVILLAVILLAVIFLAFASSALVWRTLFILHRQFSLA